MRTFQIMIIQIALQHMRALWRFLCGLGQKSLAFLSIGMLFVHIWLRVRPRPISVAARIDMFPKSFSGLDADVRVRWNDHMVPHVYAETDHDAAFMLGCLHAHLRLVQMGLARHLSQGRLAELGGAAFIDIDKGLRILGFDRVAHEVFENMPAEAKNWLCAFVEGLNAYQDQLTVYPPEYKALGMRLEPWTPEQIIGIGRIGGADVNWVLWYHLLPFRDDPDWPEIWHRALEEGADSPVSHYPVGPKLAAPKYTLMQQLLSWFQRSGSNSVAIAGQNTATGAAMIASDPHLGVTLPNLWLLAGVHCPSLNVVGLMPSGTPVFALGRNMHIGWGGTNLRAANSDLIDVANEPAAVAQTAIKVRWWRAIHFKYRITRHGPVISDAPLLPWPKNRTLALRWTGHDASDEITAMFRAAQSQSWPAFYKSFHGFGLPAQNMIYADRQGNIGQLAATVLPFRQQTHPPDIIKSAATADQDWRIMGDVRCLPHTFNPQSGFVGSANNRPAHSDIPISFFFSAKDRRMRMEQLFAHTQGMTLQKLKEMHTDTFAASSLAFLQAIKARMQHEGLPIALPAALQAWDGCYDVESQGAMAFEVFFNAFVRSVYRRMGRERMLKSFLDSGHLKWRVIKDLAIVPPAIFKASIDDGVQAMHEMDAGMVWGHVHHMVLRHILGRLPVLGRKFQYDDFAVGGSLETLMKTAHPMVATPHTVTYGAQARQLVDLSALDHNYFILLGGQDGFLGSACFLDMVPKWRTGHYIHMPLSHEGVAQEFPHCVRVAAVPK